MPIQVLMPALSPTMEKGNLAKWLKKEGDKVAPGDVIAEIETDKATMEVEAVDEGTMGPILVPEGTADVAVNTPIATILSEGESAGDAKAKTPATQSASPSAAGDKAVKWCREGNGPFILEMQTYRYRGHSMSDPAKYRTRDEVQKVRNEQDPIEQVRARLLQKKWASEEDLKKIDAEVRDVVNDAAEFATNDPEPDPSELYTDVLR